MIQIQLVIELINRIIERFNAAPRATKSMEVNLALVQTHHELRAAVDQGYRSDLNAFRLYIGPLKLMSPALIVVSHAIETRARTLHEAHLRTLAKQTSILSALEQDMREAIRELDARHQDWLPVQDLLKEILREIPQLKDVPDWTGGASSKYGTATVDQGTATGQLTDAIGDLLVGMDAVSNGNEHVGQLLRNEMKVQKVTISGADGAPWMFPRTRATGTALAQLTGIIEEATGRELTAALTARINSSADRAIDALPNPWPTTK